MKKAFSLLILILTVLSCSQTQEYSFRDTDLPDEERLDNLISLMTMDEKIDHLSSQLPGIPRLGVQGTRFVEGLHGLALSGPANWAVKGEGEAPTTTFPQAYGLAQMWDPVLHREIAAWEAYETRYLAQNRDYKSAGLIMLAPNADLGRDVRWGRTEECYGEDAYLGSVLTESFVKGLQGDHPRYWKTASLMKHFLANSNENNRFINSSDFDERLFREYYSYPFYKGVTEGGSRAFMAAYNKYNGIPCTVHPMLENITVDEWGQDGIICTDGGAFTHLVNSHKYYDNFPEAAAECIKAGITVFLDDYKSALREALDQGLVTDEEIDEAVRSNLRVMMRLGLIDNSPENPYDSIGIDDTTKPWTKQEAMDLAREATVKSIVLLKNDGLLPLKKEELKSVAVIGPSANLVVSDWYSGTPPYRVSILDGINEAAGENLEVKFAKSNKADSAVIAARESDIAIVCIGNHPLSYGLGWGQNHVYSDGREEVDRQAISIEQEDLVKLVMAANPNTVLVLVSSFPYAINWSKENVPSIMHVTQSSQEMGNGVADIVFGKESPAGRLVQTWPASIDQLLPILEYDIRKGRTYMYDKHEALFPFGHGLSYTTFEYSDLGMEKETIKDGETLNISLTLTNTGDLSSDEVVQLYVSFPDSEVERPIKALKGFRRIHVPAGESIRVSIPLEADELRYWNVEEHRFVLEKGTVNVMVGASSEDIRLRGELEAI
ncbi:MAG: glycoside hydrolase family 3 C-terminal domain-containing protein [Bacteroidales bacterium]|jgi:beta-glucosidase|nr:glycoside hydrolase family 3 C-terminal domain-containing protein [Bacteroidales bacterium]